MSNILSDLDSIAVSLFTNSETAATTLWERLQNFQRALKQWRDGWTECFLIYSLSHICQLTSGYIFVASWSLSWSSGGLFLSLFISIEHQISGSTIIGPHKTSLSGEQSHWSTQTGPTNRSFARNLMEIRFRQAINDSDLNFWTFLAWYKNAIMDVEFNWFNFKT